MKEKFCIKCNKPISPTSNGFCKEHKPGSPLKATYGVVDTSKWKPIINHRKLLGNPRLQADKEFWNPAPSKFPKYKVKNADEEPEEYVPRTTRP